MILLAHAAHWLLPALYAAPIVIVVALLVVAAVRDRRRRDENGDASAPA